MEQVLIDRLKGIINQLTTLSDEALSCINKFDENIDKAEVVSAKLEVSINRFTSELHTYFRLSQEPSADDISDFSTVQLRAEELHAELKVKLKNKITKTTSSQQNMMISSRLPKLDLAEFGGDVLEWSTFWDQFSSNIGNRNLPDVDKLLYLKAALKGDAKKTIEGLEITNKNYTIAVSTLKERYGKQSHIIDAHYSALYKVKSSDKTISDCRRTLNEIERHLRVLNSLGEDINHNHLRFLILEKFPEDIIYEMKMKINTDSIVEMRKHLEIIVAAREDAYRITQDNPTKEVENYTVETLHVKNNYLPSKQQKGKTDIRFQGNKRKWEESYKRDERTQRKSSTFHTGNNTSQKRFNERKNNSREGEPNEKKIKLSCIFCSESHYNEDCKTVQSAKDRKAKLSNHCYGCLREGHNLKKCKNKITCIHCNNGVHNRALCYKQFPEGQTE